VDDTTWLKAGLEINGDVALPQVGVADPYCDWWVANASFPNTTHDSSLGHSSYSPQLSGPTTRQFSIRISQHVGRPTALPIIEIFCDAQRIREVSSFGAGVVGKVVRVGIMGGAMFSEGCRVIASDFYVKESK
jgi:regulation of enolase protein 1 (concanavalin A-like superfamily)